MLEEWAVPDVLRVKLLFLTGTEDTGGDVELGDVWVDPELDFFEECFFVVTVVTGRFGEFGTL